MKNKLIALELRTRVMLRGRWINTKQLSDELCLCPRRIQQILEYMRGKGCDIQSRYIRREKHFQLTPSHQSTFTNSLNHDDEKTLSTMLKTADKHSEKVIIKLLGICFTNSSIKE